MDVGHQNQKIWSYYQNLQPEVFKNARPRMDFLVRRIASIASGLRGRALNVLNIGVGDAYLERQLHARGCQVTGFDPSEEAISRLRAVGIAGVAGLLPDSKLAGQSFDVVVASEVVEHIGTDVLAASIEEIHRILRPGGRFIGTVPFNEDLAEAEVHCPSCSLRFHRWGHQQSFDRDTLGNVLAACFEVQRLSVRAFVDFNGRSGLGNLRGAIRYVAGRLGYGLAAPNLYFEAAKTGSALERRNGP